ncbi:unnamed protein product, partial [Iphiclides podalirius]
MDNSGQAWQRTTRPPPQRGGEQHPPSAPAHPPTTGPIARRHKRPPLPRAPPQDGPPPRNRASERELPSDKANAIYGLHDRLPRPSRAHFPRRPDTDCWTVSSPRNIFSGEPSRPLPSIRTLSAQQRSERPSSDASTTSTEDKEEKETTSDHSTIRQPLQPRVSGNGEIAGGSYFYAAPADYTPPPRQPKAQRRHTPPETEASLLEKRTKVGPATSSPEQGPQQQQDRQQDQVSQPGARAYSQPPRSPSINTTPASNPSMSPDRRSNRDLDMEDYGGESAWTDAMSYATFANEGANQGARLTPTNKEPQPSTSYAAAALKPPSPNAQRRTSSPKAPTPAKRKVHPGKNEKRISPDHGGKAA